MSRKNIEDVYPLSPMQEGLLFHSLYAPEGGLYVTQIPYNCKGINPSALRQAWQRILDRHSIFRTAFVWKNIDKPMQVVGRQVELPFTIEDWREMSAAEQESSFEAYLAADLRRGFQLNKAPLLRIALFQTGDDTYKFLLSHHHILMDGWSTMLIFKEVFALYEAFCNAQELELEAARPFKNYIAWLQQQDMAAAETFWRENLKGLTAPTPLVVDRIPGRALSSVETYDEELLVLPATVMSALQSLSRQHQLTVNTVLQGAWALLLSRYSGERDVAFGVVVSGRPAEMPGVESMVGLFINNLMTRIEVKPDAPIFTWLKEVQEQQVEVRQYEHSPLSLVQKWSEVPSGDRLFESIISFQNFPVSSTLASASKDIESIHTIETSAYPLTLVAGVGEELVVSIRYDRRFFDAPTTSRIAGHLQTLLESIVANPQQTLSHLSLLTAAERQLLLTNWNHSPAPAAPSLCIHELFEEQVRLTPQAVAVVAGVEQVTYAELNTRANRLAHYLRSLGVGAEATVGLCVARSVEMLVGMLGILKAGAAYVPLDPQYPLERLNFMLADAHISVLVTQKVLLDAVPSYVGQAVCLDRDTELIRAQSITNPDRVATSENLAYIMYTSGSTGQPKGVSVVHKGVVRLVKETEYASFSPGEVFLQLAPITFDASTLEIWGSLLNGARLVVMLPHTPSLPELGQAIKKHGVTTLWLTAGLFNLMVDERLEDLQSLHQLLAGGDVLSVAHVKKFLAEASGCRLINGYGPTENTTFTCCYSMQGGSVSGSVPIGYPIAHTEVYILDETQQPVPVGVAGELYIGGDGLARGYANAFDLTAEKFVPHPFSEQAGARLYRTGDRVRYLPDGSIEFLGRTDNQVKVRGFRIELGEIEATLGQHERVREVVVMAREEKEAGIKQLIAYVVPVQVESVTPGELRAYLTELLPEYMVPGSFVLLEKFPLTQNGKIDFKALPQPGEAELEPEETYVAPRNSVEETITCIWSPLLGVERVGVNDNFFALGGNSIFAIQLASRLNKAFNLELQLRLIYDQPTVAALAATIVQAQAEQADADELDRLLAELEDISEDDARTLLAG
jgi:amino acid adenylation domain-containing protein